MWFSITGYVCSTQNRVNFNPAIILLHYSSFYLSSISSNTSTTSKSPSSLTQLYSGTYLDAVPVEGVKKAMRHVESSWFLPWVDWLWMRSFSTSIATVTLFSVWNIFAKIGLKFKFSCSKFCLVLPSPWILSLTMCLLKFLISFLGTHDIIVQFPSTRQTRTGVSCKFKVPILYIVSFRLMVSHHFMKFLGAINPLKFRHVDYIWKTMWRPTYYVQRRSYSLLSSVT